MNIIPNIKEIVPDNLLILANLINQRGTASSTA